MRILLLSLFLFLAVAAAKAQQAKPEQEKKMEYGVAVFRYFSGNGLVSKTNPALALEYGNQSLNIGPLWGVEGVTGGLAVLKQELVFEILDTKPYLFISAAYTKGGNLKRSLVNILASSADDFLYETRNNYEVFEAFAGFGLTTNVRDNWYIDANLGVGRYQTLNAGELGNRPEHFLIRRPDKEFVLSSRIGLIYKF